MKTELYIGQTVYLDIPGSDLVGKVRGWSTDYSGTTYAVLWNDGQDGAYYAEELTTQKRVDVT